MIQFIHNIFIQLLSLLIFSGGLFGQELPSSFEQKLDLMNLVLELPAEGKLINARAIDNIFFDYQLKLKDKKRQLELFIILNEESSADDIIQFPHITFMRLVSNIATNSQENEIMVVTWDDKKLEKRNADWGSEAYVTIRKSLSNFPNAKLISFYKESRGLVTILYCFDNPFILPDLLSFEPDPDND
jgi:hypothetical protein